MVYAYEKISFLMPLDAKKVTCLKEEGISHLDQYIFRFSKLQDAVGQKLFGAVLDALGEETRNKPFIDVFNRMEQLGIVVDWIILAGRNCELSVMKLPMSMMTINRNWQKN